MKNNLISELIERLGGKEKLAKELGLKWSAVHNWPYRGRVPREQWEILMNKGATLEELTGIGYGKKEIVEGEKVKG